MVWWPTWWLLSARFAGIFHGGDQRFEGGHVETAHDALAGDRDRYGAKATRDQRIVGALVFVNVISGEFNAGV